MSAFLDDLLKKMKTAPHVGVPTVTNPKVPTKVERDTAEYAARQKPMPTFVFGTGTPLEKLKEQMAIAHHPTPTYADPKFNKPEVFGPHCTLSKAELDAFDANYKQFKEKVKAKNNAKSNNNIIKEEQDDFEPEYQKFKAKVNSKG